MSIKCECGSGPWIKVSQCKAGFGMFHKTTGELLEVGCPSMLCYGLVPVVDGKIGDHDASTPDRCPWIGTRVIDDRADFVPRYVSKTHPNHGA